MPIKVEYGYPGILAQQAFAIGRGQRREYREEQEFRREQFDYQQQRDLMDMALRREQLKAQRQQWQAQLKMAERTAQRNAEQYQTELQFRRWASSRDDERAMMVAIRQTADEVGDLLEPNPKKTYNPAWYKGAQDIAKRLAETQADQRLPNDVRMRILMGLHGEALQLQAQGRERPEGLEQIIHPQTGEPIPGIFRDTKTGDILPDPEYKRQSGLDDAAIDLRNSIITRLIGDIGAERREVIRSNVKLSQEHEKARKTWDDQVKLLVAGKQIAFRTMNKREPDAQEKAELRKQAEADIAADPNMPQHPGDLALREPPEQEPWVSDLLRNFGIAGQGQTKKPSQPPHADIPHKEMTKPQRIEFLTWYAQNGTEDEKTTARKKLADLGVTVE